MATTEQVKPVWKCRVEGCGYNAAPTEEGYRKVMGHQLAHISMLKEKKGFCLVDENTGEILAEKLAEAAEKGLIKTELPEEKPKAKEDDEGTKEAKEVTRKVPPEEKPKAKEEDEGKEDDEGKKEAKEVTTPKVSSEGVFRYTISLPADAFMLFNIAKSYGLETDNDKPFDEWVWDCIQKRFEKDYKKRLVLAPTEV